MQRIRRTSGWRWILLGLFLGGTGCATTAPPVVRLADTPPTDDIRHAAHRRHTATVTPLRWDGPRTGPAENGLPPGAAPATDAQPTPRDRLHTLHRSLFSAETRVGKARLALDQAALSQTEAILHAENTLRLARRRLALFDDQLAPQRLARATLELQNARDRHAAAEQRATTLHELHRTGNFADPDAGTTLTAAERDVARAAQWVALCDTQLRTLRELTLPFERLELQTWIAQREHELAWLRRAHETTLHDREVALLDAETRVNRLQQELDSLRAELDAAHTGRAPAARSAAAPLDLDTLARELRARRARLRVLQQEFDALVQKRDRARQSLAGTAGHDP